MPGPIRILVAGCGNMGSSHARAYRRMPEFEIAGVVSRGPESRGRLSRELGGVPEFGDFREALEEAAPAAVSINTYPDTHAGFAIAAMEAGAHVFVEKPLAETAEAAEEVAAAAARHGRKLVVGYILRHHPSWMRFVEMARGLGKPLVMRMNLNQQSRGETWKAHQSLINAVSPIVDCGVHYVDMMGLMTGARPARVHAVAARLSEDLRPESYNYGQLQIVFDDGSVGWYEVGWGPMMSELAYSVKDVIGPGGSVSIVPPGADARSDDVASHTQVRSLRHHRGRLDADGNFERDDRIIELGDEPDHDALCEREQRFFARAIVEDLDLTAPTRAAIDTLRIVLAADESARTGEAVRLEGGCGGARPECTFR